MTEMASRHHTGRFRPCGGHTAVVALCLLSAAGAGAYAPQGAPQNPPVFRSGVDLVTVDVSVVDRDGKPVKGLKPDDFVVTLDGLRRPVRALDYFEVGSTSGPNGEPSAPATNQVTEAARSRGGRVIVLIVDDLSAKPAQMIGLRTAAQRMLATLDPGDLVGVATTSGLGPVVNPTRDRAAVRTVLESKQIVGRYDDSTAPLYISLPEAIDINRTVSQTLMSDSRYTLADQSTYGRVVRRECDHVSSVSSAPSEDVDGTCPSRVIKSAAQLGKNLVSRAAAQLAAYAQFIEALRAAPAPRVIIALSAGVALGIDLGGLDLVSRAAAKAGVQFYALTEVPDSADVTDISADRAAARREEEAFLTAGVQTVAEAAGGEAFKIVGQADRFFSRIMTETSGMYQLGVEAPPLPLMREFVKVKVSVSRPDVTVRTNTHALAPAAAPAPVSIEDVLRARIAQGGAASGVPIALGTALRRDPAGTQLQLSVNVQVPAVIVGPLTAMFAVVDDQGRIVQQGRTQVPPSTPTQDYQLALPVPLDPGQYRLRVAVADARGNIGSLEQPVTATLTHLGTYTVSELFTTWIGADGVPRILAHETLSDSATTLRVSLELYPDDPAAAPDLTVRLALVPLGETDPFVERDLTPAGTGSTRTVAASLPTDQLNPGVYTIRATILEAGAVTGTVSALIRKQ
jgi:VWFA-related protein